MAIAAPLLAECKPISFAVNPRTSAPSVVATRRRHFRSSDPENICFLPSGKRKRFTVSVGEAPGYEASRFMIAAQVQTGHNTLSPDRCWVITSFLVSLF
jgi:hypothetical protein